MNILIWFVTKITQSIASWSEIINNYVHFQ